MPSHPRELAPFLEAALLSERARQQDVRALAQDVVLHDLTIMTVLPYWVPLVVDILAPHHIKVGTVVSYPHGMERAGFKRQAMLDGVDEGVSEVMVTLNQMLVDEEHWSRVEREVQDLLLRGIVLKVGVNVSRLISAGVRTLTRAVQNGGANFLLLHSDGDIPARDDVQQAVWTAGDDLEVMTGGNCLHNLAALRYVNSGAARVTTSAPVRILR